jgi:hypothetical protein
VTPKDHQRAIERPVRIERPRPARLLANPV